MKFRVRKTPIWVFGGGAAILTVPAVAFQASDVLSYSVGPVTLRPGVVLSQRYDDNILYRQDGPTKIGDFVTTLNPNLTLILGHKPISNPWIDEADFFPNYISVGYTLSENVYAKTSDLNYADQTIDTESQYTTSRVYITGRDRFQILNGIVGGYENVGAKAGRIAFSDNYKVGYNITEKTSVYVMGSYSAVDYASGTLLLDVNTWRGTLGLMWKALPKTSFFSEGFYGQTAVNPNVASLKKGPHLTSLGGYVGMSRLLATKFKGTVKVGLEQRQFVGNTGQSITPVVEGRLSYMFTQKTTAELRYVRSSNVSLQQIGVAYTSDNMGMSLYQTLTPSGKLRAVVGGNYTISSFDQTANNPSRNDNWLSLNAGLTYYLRAWMTTSLGYEYEKFSINYSQRFANIIDYNASRVTLRLAIGY